MEFQHFPHQQQPPSRCPSVSMELHHPYGIGSHQPQPLQQPMALPMMPLPPPVMLTQQQPLCPQLLQPHQSPQLLHQQQQQQQLAGCPIFQLLPQPQPPPPPPPPPPQLPSSISSDASVAGASPLLLLPQAPSFDLVRWYSEKPPFILDGRTACLYKMRELDDRKLPANLVLSGDPEFNTVLAEFAILRTIFGRDFAMQERVFIKLNRGKEGELAKFIHIFFRERADAQRYMASAHRLGCHPPAWSNPRSFSRHNVYITSVPFFLLSKDALCAFVRAFLQAGTGGHCGSGSGGHQQPPADPIRRARVDAEKRSAQVEFHRTEDAEAVIEYFYFHMPEANARPAFDNKEPQMAAADVPPADDSIHT